MNPNTKEAFAKNAGRIGYIATIQLPGTQALWHLRLGTHNNASGDTHDHYFAVGDAQRDVKINSGYSLVGVQPVGYVYTPSSLPRVIALVGSLNDFEMAYASPPR